MPLSYPSARIGSGFVWRGVVRRESSGVSGTGGLGFPDSAGDRFPRRCATSRAVSHPSASASAISHPRGASAGGATVCVFSAMPDKSSASPGSQRPAEPAAPVITAAPSSSASGQIATLRPASGDQSTRCRVFEPPSQQTAITGAEPSNRRAASAVFSPSTISTESVGRAASSSSP